MFFFFVSHTDFTLFEKGMLWHEHMCIFPRFPSTVFIPLKHLLPLTEINFWKRISLPPPVKGVDGGSYVVLPVRSHTTLFLLCTQDGAAKLPVLKLISKGGVAANNERLN